MFVAPKNKREVSKRLVQRSEWWKKALVYKEWINEAKFTPKTKRNCVLKLVMGETSLIDANRLENLLDELLELSLRDVMVCFVMDE